MRREGGTREEWGGGGGREMWGNRKRAHDGETQYRMWNSRNGNVPYINIFAVSLSILDNLMSYVEF